MNDNKNGDVRKKNDGRDAVKAYSALGSYHAKYVVEMIKTSRTNAPAATPYTQVFSFPSA